ncbi:hypothetical protein AMJ80_10925 [bacterium SM23_31]|nr:MAG: hypothetical protein AMJ80_10925 [bacterium SM23_31]
MKEKEIRLLIKILEETGITELEVTKWWGQRIRIVKNGAAQNINEQELRDGMTIEIPPKTDSQTGKKPEEL